jgi:hypothetical protein
LWPVLFATGVLVATSAMTWAATAPSGTTIAVVQASEANGVTGRRTLSVQGPVYSGDRVTTGNIGEAQLLFRDGTRLVVGPNSSMVLDAFVFNDDNTAREVTIGAVRGAFRFITGNGPKDAYTINTPTATISVRGTAFDFNVDALGTTRTAVVEGGIMNCDRLPPPRRTCVFQTGDCDIIVTETGRLPRAPLSNEERRRDLLSYFPYFRSQTTLVAAFRLDVDGCGIARGDGGTSPPTLTLDIPTFAAVLPSSPPPPPPPPPPPDDACHGNCGNGQGNGGGNGTGNEGNGNGPPEGHGGGKKDKD